VSQRHKLSFEVQNQVRERAKYLCEYCHTSEKWQYVSFTIDHVVPLAHNIVGTDTLNNLALACFHCNRRKSNKTTVIDYQTGEFVPLFNPRQHTWSEHFSWSNDGTQILPLTAIGRVTVDLLELNRERIMRIRWADVLVGRHPPNQSLGTPH